MRARRAAVLALCFAAASGDTVSLLDAAAGADAQEELAGVFGAARRGVLGGHLAHLRRLAADGTIRAVLSSRAASSSGSGRPGAAQEGAMAATLSARRLRSASVGDLPESFDAAQQWPACAELIRDIQDQSNCGCCWATAVSAVVADRLCVASQGRIALPLSAQQLCFCASRDGWGCFGGWPAEAYFYVRAVGLVTGQQQRFDARRFAGPDPDRFGNASLCAPYTLPHCHHHGPLRGDPFPAEDTLGCPAVPDGGSPECPTSCAPSALPPHSDFSLDKHSFSGDVEWHLDADSIAAAIVECGPVSATVSVFTDMEQYVSGVYSKGANVTRTGSHAVRITGFGVDEDGVKYWTVANSWNPYWGESGFFRIRRGTDEVGIEGSVLSPACDVTWNTPLGQFRG
eukprot:TRINITY_DN3741_c0_g1_i2.p1 TRINITY_DN3741_c0_g1~~TRINITY_DN3741_c0_g1_i2.p1  ORF type:complete len:400 (+),score=107.04 TRINITY_DN3741_c0_g1_i2:53-1252(+)